MINMKKKKLTISLFFRINGDEAEPASFLMGFFVTVLLGTDLRVPHGIDVDFVPKTVVILACVVEAMLGPRRVRHPNLIRAPPSWIAGSDGRRAKRPKSIPLLIDTVLRQ